jgi:hypothetical protein
MSAPSHPITCQDGFAMTTSTNDARIAAITIVGAVLVTVGGAATLPRVAGAQASGSFQTLMNAATARMHAAMHVTPTGDADRDFARMMVPHHQGAVDMALLELQFGKDERLRRLAQGIIVEQRQEIQLMQSILAEAPRPATSSAPVAPHHHDERGGN